MNTKKLLTEYLPTIVLLAAVAGVWTSFEGHFVTSVAYAQGQASDYAQRLQLELNSVNISISTAITQINYAQSIGDVNTVTRLQSEIRQYETRKAQITAQLSQQ